MKLRCIIVDDEVLAQNVLEKYIRSVPSLELIEKFHNAIETIAFLQESEIDLIFLDINMPELSGIEMLKTLDRPPKVILTTAYSDFALESYDLGVVDYLLKPIKFDRFIKAVNKVINLHVKNPLRELMEKSGVPDSSQYLFLKEDQSVHKVDFRDILYIEAFGNYLKVYEMNSRLVVRETLTNLEVKLPVDQFIRVHKSYVVSVDKIDKVANNEIHIRENRIPIGYFYKQELFRRINNQ
ncbi:MAG: LytTR family DNA-binding domain-containing protein [Bacteroidia bacterium]|nr:LytTR family DNA-binding domain-containing protein [Bacteroidia bacterium]